MQTVPDMLRSAIAASVIAPARRAGERARADRFDWQRGE